MLHSPLAQQRDLQDFRYPRGLAPKLLLAGLLEVLIESQLATKAASI